MKKPFNVFDGLFLLALLLKLTKTDPIPSWFEVFLPYILEFVYVVAVHFWTLDKWPEKLAFRLWKFQTSRKVKEAAKKAGKVVKSGNPGAYERNIKPLR